MAKQVALIALLIILVFIAWRIMKGLVATIIGLVILGLIIVIIFNLKRG